MPALVDCWVMIVMISTIRTQTMRKKRVSAREKKYVIFFKLGAFIYLGE
jgi:hypothetical protein